LQRRVRYAAALARLDRWSDAEPLFRAAERGGAFLQLPAERAVLLRVFSQELYAPALVAEMLRSAPPSAAPDMALTLAQHEAWLLARLSRTLRTLRTERTERSGVHREPASTSRWALALCAYLAGELERAYELFDEVEGERPGDLAVHFLLWRCARAIGHTQAESIGVFAKQAARAAWAKLQAAALREDLAASSAEQRAGFGQQLQYAVAIVPELDPELAGLASQLGAHLPDATSELQAALGSVESQLERVVAFRTSHDAGRSPLAAAAASTHALAAVAASSHQ
jgi:hypothetical protein